MSKGNESVGATGSSAAGDGLDVLRVLALQVATAEARLATLRSDRDGAIHDAVRAGHTERAAARAAGVSPSYAHRAAKRGRAARRG